MCTEADTSPGSPVAAATREIVIPRCVELRVAGGGPPPGGTAVEGVAARAVVGGGMVVDDAATVPLVAAVAPAVVVVGSGATGAVLDGAALCAGAPTLLNCSDRASRCCVAATTPVHATVIAAMRSTRIFKLISVHCDVAANLPTTIVEMTPTRHPT